MGKKATLLLIHYMAGIFTIILAIITVISYRCNHITAHTYPIISFTNMALQFLLFADILLSVWWIIRCKFWFWFPLIALIYCLPAIYTVYRPPFLRKTIKAGSRTTLKVATFNIAGFDGEPSHCSVSALSEDFRKDNPDVICMQEFAYTKDFGVDSIARYFNEYPYYVVDKHEPSLLLAIYSKYPITDSHSYRIGDNNINGMILVSIDVNGKTVDMLTCHLNTTNFNQKRGDITTSMQQGISEKFSVSKGLINTLHTNFLIREKQANTVNSLKKQFVHNPLITCGDLNSTPFSCAYSRVRGYQNDAFIDNGKGYGNTYKYLHSLFRIDHIFYDKQSFEVVDCEVKRNYDFSDHYPQIATFIIK